MIYKSISVSKQKPAEKTTLFYLTQDILSIIACLTIGFVFIIFCLSNPTKSNTNISNDIAQTISTQTKSMLQSIPTTSYINQSNPQPQPPAPEPTQDNQIQESSLQQIKFAEPIPAWNQHITSHFGQRENPIHSGNEYHKGLDIAMPTGTPIKAVLDGTVTISEENSKSYGKYIEITHSDTLKTRYAHCSELKVKKGDTVHQGDIIALVGSTGNSTGPHLHLEAIENGVKVNPEKYLQ